MQTIHIFAEGVNVGTFKGTLADAVEHVQQAADEAEVSRVEVEYSEDNLKAVLKYAYNPAKSQAMAAKLMRIGDVHADYPSYYTLKVVDEKPGYQITGTYFD